MTADASWQLPPLSDRALARLAEHYSDAEVTTMMVDLLSGCTVDLHLYRLSCGHILDLRVNPLPTDITRVYCGRPAPPRHAAGFVDVAEHLLSIPGGAHPVPDPNEDPDTL